MVFVLGEQAISEVESNEIDLVECHISDVQDVAQSLVENGCQILLCTGATGVFYRRN